MSGRTLPAAPALLPPRGTGAPEIETGPTPAGRGKWGPITGRITLQSPDWDGL